MKNIKLARKHYPGFVCRFYVEKSSPSDWVAALGAAGAEVVLAEETSYEHRNMLKKYDHSGLFWRFEALADSEVDVVLSRDCDSRISQRESDAVREWLSSDKKFHIMRDHPNHAVPILNGMWGCRGGLLSDIRGLLSQWSRHEKKGIYHADDQDFLGQIIYPLVAQDSMEHAEFGLKFRNKIRSFPGVRSRYEFVGDVFDENEKRHPDYWKSLRSKETSIKYRWHRIWDRLAAKQIAWS